MPVSNQCPLCAHYVGDLSCEAFPDGIPVAILQGDYDHSDPYPGDNGIQFEPIGETPTAEKS